MPAAIMECGDFSEFQDALKNMRRPDDLLINTLNTVLTTDSFRSNEEKACKDLYNSLEEGASQRKAAIKNCISFTTERVKNLKEQKNNNLDDLQLSKTLRSEQTKLRMLQVELTVENMIKDRTSKVFSEKCRKFFKPL